MSLLGKFNVRAQKYFNKYVQYKKWIQEFEEKYKFLEIPCAYKIDQTTCEKYKCCLKRLHQENKSDLVDVELVWTNKYYDSESQYHKMENYSLSRTISHPDIFQKRIIQQDLLLEMNNNELITCASYIPAFIAAFTMHIEKFMEDHKEYTGFDDIVDDLKE